MLGIKYLKFCINTLVYLQMFGWMFFFYSISCMILDSWLSFVSGKTILVLPSLLNLMKLPQWKPDCLFYCLQPAATFTNSNDTTVIKWLQTMLTVWRDRKHFNTVRNSYVFAYLDIFYCLLVDFSFYCRKLLCPCVRSDRKLFHQTTNIVEMGRWRETKFTQ